jgi:hypothetical protein
MGINLGIKRFNLQSQIDVRFSTTEKIFFSNTGIFNSLYNYLQVTNK